jgi:hypothetical protein
MTMALLSSDADLTKYVKDAAVVGGLEIGQTLIRKLRMQCLRELINIRHGY